MILSEGITFKYTYLAANTVLLVVSESQWNVNSGFIISIIFENTLIFLMSRVSSYAVLVQNAKILSLH